MTTVSVHCSICQDLHPLGQFRFLPCGHGFCATSIERYIRHQKLNPKRCPCPMCRETFDKDLAHEVFLDLQDPDSPSACNSDSKQPPLPYTEGILKQAAYARDKIQLLDQSSSAESIRRTGSEIRKVIDGVSRDHCAMETMLLAIADFWQRVAPLFAAVSSQKDEIATLQNNLRAVKEERTRAGKDCRKAQRLACEAIETADRARHEVVALREENDKLKRQMEAQRQEHVKQLAEEASKKTSLRDTILAHKHKEAKQKAKIEALRKELAEHGLTISSLRQSVTRMQSCSGSSQSQSHSQISTAMPDSQISRFREPYSGAGEDDELILDSQSQVDVDDLYAEPELISELPHTARVSAPQSQSAMPQRPIFGADWNLPPEPRAKRKRTASVDHRPREAAFPIALDGKGRPKGVVQLGSRQRHK